MGIIKRALRRTSRKLLNKIIPPTHSHQLVLNPRCTGELASHEAEHLAGKRKLASLQRRFKKSSNSKDTAVAEAMLLAVKNHLPPLQFHHVHGPHAQLSSNRCVARRTQSFCQALVFSNRVILPNERVYIKVLEISKCWSGTIRFGFTAVDPATLACRMPKHACPDMTNAGHTWARALADEVVRRNSVIHFSYNKNGVIHYGINNQDCGIFHANVRTSQNLWFIVDIYGLTAAVELIDPRVNNGPNNGINFSPQEAITAVAEGQSHRSTMYKSTSAMEELFGGRYGGSSSRRKKLLRKHARHAAMIQAANWPMDNHYAGAYGQHAEHVNQLPNLNSMSLPSTQQNIYSPMPNAAALAEQQQTQQRMRNEPHDYHQIVTNTHSYGACQPLRVATGASTLNGSISLANIAAPEPSGSSGGAVLTNSSSHNGAGSISQADLSHQLENMRLYERRMRKHAAATLSKSANQTPIAATRTRQHLQQINTNQTNHKRAPEITGRDQPDKSASSSSNNNQRILSTKSASSSTATSTSKTSSSGHGSVKPKTRHSIMSRKTLTPSAAANNNSNNNNNSDNNPPSKDCPICFERPINCVLYQCGHMCTCYECGVKQWKTQSRTCPICRTVIKDVIKTYMS